MDKDCQAGQAWLKQSPCPLFDLKSLNFLSQKPQPSPPDFEPDHSPPPALPRVDALQGLDLWEFLPKTGNNTQFIIPK
ncbi:MAG: hypothetical protein RBR38_01530 [Desulfomicrobium apsheronum]|uniref:hypothetical protein n=1 Tax=Desulfomicrobium apsheronum TaxID=52560 RepID=UPI0011604AB9|nr:hypothetical protein [Desulfomicrobium apsheronum]MDY0225490.1 hypothetical protein [Desulfomicrobium apsheronum]